MDNIIRAVFGGQRYTTTKSAWLIDHGMVLQIKGVELPEVYEVDFSNSKTEQATRVLGNADGVVIPDQYFLSKAQQIYAWVYLTTGDSGFTTLQVMIPLSQRPDVTDIEPTPAEADIIEQAIAALNDGVERAETAADNAEAAVANIQQTVDDALQAAKDSGEFDGRDGEDGTDGVNGVTFTPDVDAAGNISWTNDGGLPNPQTRNIKGPQGEKLTYADLTAADKADLVQGPILDAQTAAVNAVNSKGEEVIQSIPSDYTELSEDVDDLKSAIDNNSKDAAIELTLNPGYINNNGTIAAQSSTNLEVYSSYFDVTPGEILTIEFQNPNSKTMWSAVGKRGFNNGWIGRSVIVSSGNNTYYKVDYTVPSGTYRLSVTYRTYGSITATVKHSQNIYYPYQDGEQLAERVDTLEEIVEPVKHNNIKHHAKVYSTNHRGWNGSCPENTLPAFKQSVVQGFDQVETDIRFTSDNVPVLLHDSTINRTARNADGSTISGDVSISSITYAQALEYDFGIYKGAEFAGTKIPTLAQFLSLCKNVGLVPYLEIEGDYSDEKTEIIADVVKSSGIADNVVFISNYTGAIAKLIALFPSNRFGVSPWTYDSTYLTFAKTLFNNKAEIFMHLSVSDVTPELVETLKTDNLPLEIWVANSTAILAANSYVSGYTSNDAVASKVLYNSEIA